MGEVYQGVFRNRAQEVTRKEPCTLLGSFELDPMGNEKPQFKCNYTTVEFIP